MIRRIPVKKATATNLLELNRLIGEKKHDLEVLLTRMNDHLSPIYTENGIVEGMTLEVTEKEPYEVVVQFRP